MSLFTVTDFVCAAACASLAAVVLLSNPRRITNLSFGGAMLATAAMVFGLGVAELRSDTDDFHFWMRWTFAALALVVPLWLAFATVFARANWRQIIRRRALPLLAALALGSLFFFAAVGAPDFLMSSEDDGRDLPLGAWGSYFHIYLLACSIALLATIERTFRGAHEFQRWKIKHVLLGLALLFGLFTFYSIQVLVYRQASFALLRVSTLAVLAACACMAISVRRDRFLEFRFMVSHKVVYRSIAFIASGLYLIFAAVTVNWLRSMESPYLQGLAVFSALLFFSLLFLSTSFRLRARRWLQRNIFRSRFDYRDQWQRAVESLKPEPVLELLAEKLAEFVQNGLGVKEVATWLCRERDGRRELCLLASRGLGEVRWGRVFDADGLVTQLEADPEPFEVAVQQERLERAGTPMPGKEIFELSQAVLCVPLVSGSHLVGLFTAGPRITGEAPAAEDLEYLRVLGSYAASQLHNAQLLDKLVAAKEAEAFRTLSTFLIHDLKNFTSTLTLIAQNASQHQQNPEFLRDAFNSVTKIAQTMNRLCGSLGTMVGSLRVNPQMGDLNEVVAQTVEALDHQGEGQIVLRLGRLPKVSLDTEKIRSVLTNLIINSQQAVGESGTIEVATRERGAWVEAEVKDNGPGIPREFLEKELFVPFHTTKSGGTGIGLFQSKSIVQAHGGKIEVESEEGKGTLVRLLLPAGKSAAAPEPEAASMKAALDAQPGPPAAQTSASSRQ